jgi:AcrR family transcriptional regulator
MVAQASLRERKKARTRASLREHALRLFREQGYQATTVEQIAAAADVSPSTFFRYFPTKEDVVLQDDMDTRLLEAFARQPADLTPIAAVRAAVREAWASFSETEWEQIKEGGKLSLEVQEIRSRSMDEFSRIINVIADGLASRTGRPAGDMRVRAFAGAVMGVMMSAFLPQGPDTQVSAEAMADWMGPSSVERVDAALALLEEGLPL